METENAVVEVGTEVIETPIVEAPVNQEAENQADAGVEIPSTESTQEGEIDIMALIEKALSPQNETQTAQEEVVTRPTSFENKPVTEKDLDGFTKEFESILEDQDKIIAEKSEVALQKELEVQELTSKFSALEEDYTNTKAENQRLSDFFVQLEATPIIGEIALAIAGGQKVDVPSALRAYAEQLKNATTAGNQTQVSAPSKPAKSAGQRIADLSNSGYIN